MLKPFKGRVEKGNETMMKNITTSAGSVESDSPTFCLIIATRDRPDMLARMLNSALIQKKVNASLIVVDQSSDGVFKINQANIEKVRARGLTIDHIRSQERGLSRARNHGIEHLPACDFVGFPDDDCWYDDDLLLRVSIKFKENPIIDGLLGQYADPPAEFNSRFPQEVFLMRSTHFFGASVGFFFKASLFTDANLRFDTNIGAGTEFPAGEDNEFFLQAKAQGAEFWYYPDIVVFHSTATKERSPREMVALEAASTYIYLTHAFRHDLHFLMKALGRLVKIALLSPFSKIGRARLRGTYEGMKLLLRRA